MKGYKNKFKGYSWPPTKTISLETEFNYKVFLGTLFYGKTLVYYSRNQSMLSIHLKSDYCSYSVERTALNRPSKSINYRIIQ